MNNIPALMPDQPSMPRAVPNGTILCSFLNWPGKRYGTAPGNPPERPANPSPQDQFEALGSTGHVAFLLALLQTNSSVTPAGVRGLVNLSSSALMAVTMRRWLGAPNRLGNVLVLILACTVLVFSSTVKVPVYASEPVAAMAS
jgi:hypothetical protein